MGKRTLLKISATLILLGLILILHALLTGCGSCRPTADPTRIRGLAQRHSLTAMNLAETVVLECEHPF